MPKRDRAADVTNYGGGYVSAALRGEPNPCPCDTDFVGRRHWLLNC